MLDSIITLFILIHQITTRHVHSLHKASSDLDVVDIFPYSSCVFVAAINTFSCSRIS